MGSEIIRIVEQAHMAGQYNAGVDPSYSEARVYCSGIELPNVDELKAHIEILRNVILDAACELVESDITDDDGLQILHETLLISLAETPAQSLNHIRAQVEKEIVMEIIDIARKAFGDCNFVHKLQDRKNKYGEA